MKTATKAISKLGFGPMSSEIIEAVFRFSEKNQEPLMLIASKNQIDWNGGYVNNWNTKEFMCFVSGLKQKYSSAKVYVCRDHCGPGFKDKDLRDTYKTIDNDIENGLDLVHIDFSKLQGDYDDILKESKKAIEYIQKIKPEVLIEVGTDENKGEFLEDISKIENEMKFFTSIAEVQFFVCQTGSLIKEINQIGSFNVEFIKKVRETADKYNVFLKEHNADYLDSGQIKTRKGLIDAVNVAPQYGVIQTMLTFHKALNYGIDIKDFLQEAYQSRRWEKWLDTNTSDNKLLCSVIAGHYVFSSDAYKRLCEGINKYENFRESIVSEIMKNFKVYYDNL